MVFPMQKKFMAATISAVLLSASALPTEAQTVDTNGLELALPAWGLVFQRNGVVNRQRLDVGEAFSFADPLSNGRAVDPTVLFRRVAEDGDGNRFLQVSRSAVVQNTVRAANDLGHIYLVSGVSSSASRATYIAAEVLTRNARQTIQYEFELTQKRHDIVESTGPDRLMGNYTAGDLRALVTFKRGLPNDILLKRMQLNETGTLVWKSISRRRFDAGNCADDGDNMLSCVSSLPNGGAIRSKLFGVTSNRERVRLPAEDLRIEIGLDIDELSGVSVSWDTMIVRSKFDLAVMHLVNGVTGTGTFSSGTTTTQPSVEPVIPEEPISQ